MPVNPAVPLDFLRFKVAVDEAVQGKAEAGKSVVPEYAAT
jgi:hypothetical protein